VLQRLDTPSAEASREKKRTNHPASKSVPARGTSSAPPCPSQRPRNAIDEKTPVSLFEADFCQPPHGDGVTARIV
jgi:hypothetical protein